MKPNKPIENTIDGAKKTNLTDLVWPIEEIEKSNNVIVYILAKWIASVFQQETNTKRHRRDKEKQHKEKKSPFKT